MTGDTCIDVISVASWELNKRRVRTSDEGNLGLGLQFDNGHGRVAICETVYVECANGSQMSPFAGATSAYLLINGHF